MKYELVNENFEKDYIVSLLAARGVEDIEEFLNPTEKSLQDYMDLENMEEGAALLLKTINNNGKILLIVDSDPDGYTSSAILYLYLKKIFPKLQIDYWVHEKKQHGLEDHIDNLMETDYNLVITPDAGSNDFEYHERLKEINLPVLVLDHHLLDEGVSSNAVIINNQTSPSYKNKALTGAGVVYQFCRFLDELLGVEYSHLFMDLAALGIVADMGSMLNQENRYIVKRGFEKIYNFFFNALIEKQSFPMKGKINPMTVAFYITPLINAMIRVGTIEEKTTLFEAFINGIKTIPSRKRGAQGEDSFLAVEVARECGNARNRQNTTKEKVTDMLEAKIHKHGLLENEVLFLRLDEDDPEFPQELTGLIAMQLSQKFKKPTILAKVNSEGFIRGSMRGLNGTELESFKDFLESSKLFEYVSGHDNAAGISILESYLSDFHEFSNKELKDVDFGENLHQVNFIKQAVDSNLSDLIIDVANYEELWGQENPTPNILVKDIFVNKSDIDILGAKKNTIKFKKNDVEYIQFRADKLIDEIDKYGDSVMITVIGRAGINDWGGQSTPQIMIKDYQIEDGAMSF